MTESLWDVTLAELRARTAGPDPTPGGGSVAAVTAALGCALVLMALEITAKRDPSVGDAIAAGQALLDRLGPAADRDVELFQDYLRARRLPRSTEEERAARQAAVAAASVAATEGPLAAAADAVRALEWASSVLPLVAGTVVSDVRAGADLLLGSVLATLRGAEANLAQPGDGAAALTARLDDVRRAAVAAHARIESTPEESR
ncbi:cyclodeaminase/cyclohydrolase family protein [Saccharothrix sp. S26]|uniref:cyclodeaminase/cyclohydrolase family protein n=1 Tax=Saccharothrix sp. S26 TaxID=2907215 RepID=UPI001F185BEF|nr:cyclodeaminase/cyclohydrolase family protein [Saccharothrix sp. S26]MCE7000725.1 cyclodeaminase/cyclohydrolase family protein [Saccharothrix sp. S26]